MGDGQVSQGDMVVKPNATKVRKLGDGSVLAGYAGSTADALTLMERLEGKLEEHDGEALTTDRQNDNPPFARRFAPYVGLSMKFWVKTVAVQPAEDN